MAATGHGATFSFTSNKGTIGGRVTKVTVESPVAEVVDVTGLYDTGDASVLVPTGAWRGGSVSVDFIAGPATPGVQSVVRGIGQLVFASSGINVSRRAILESGSE